MDDIPLKITEKVTSGRVRRSGAGKGIKLDPVQSVEIRSVKRFTTRTIRVAVTRGLHHLNFRLGFTTRLLSVSAYVRAIFRFINLFSIFVRANFMILQRATRSLHNFKFHESPGLAFRIGSGWSTDSTYEIFRITLKCDEDKSNFSFQSETNFRGGKDAIYQTFGPNKERAK